MIGHREGSDAADHAEDRVNSGRSSPISKAMPSKKAATPPRAVKVSRSQRMPGIIADAA